MYLICRERIRYNVTGGSLHPAICQGTEGCELKGEKHKIHKAMYAAHFSPVRQKTTAVRPWSFTLHYSLQSRPWFAIQVDLPQHRLPVPVNGHAGKRLIHYAAKVDSPPLSLRDEIFLNAVHNMYA
jgi:hypothetical protein